MAARLLAPARPAKSFDNIERARQLRHVKIVWVITPLALYGVYLGVAALVKRPPARFALNVHTSLLLMLYVLTTAGLGVFWVANQQLPVFDWHYLFGYATLLLLTVHLSFNLPAAVRFLRKSRGRPGSHPTRRSIGLGLGIAAALGGAFWLGMRHGRSELAVAWQGGSSERGPTEAIERYHDFSSHSRAGVLARAPGVDWGPAPAAFKSYPQAEHVDLPPPRRGGRPLGAALAGPAEARQLDLEALATILFHAAGITAERGGFSLRAAPSSGALFPTEVYALARSVAGLPAGIYHYDARGHRLAKLSRALPDERTLGLGEGELGAPVLFVLSSVFRRPGHKYRDRAYRYAAADAGHLLENLRIASHEAGWPASPLARYDEARVAAALEIDGVEEGVMTVVPLGQRERATGARFVAPAAPEEGTRIGVTGMVHVATSLRLREPEPRSAVEGSRLLAPSDAEMPALEAIAARRSQRRFSDEPLALADLAGLLRDAFQPALLSRAIVLYVVASRVADLAPGVYRYEPRVGALVATRRGDLSREAERAALSQEVIGDAAAVFVFAADREKLFSEHGARGYRHAFLEMGMMGERVLLGAISRGLGACPVGAFYDDEAAALVGVEPEAQWVLHFAGVGRLTR